MLSKWAEYAPDDPKPPYLNLKQAVAFLAVNPEKFRLYLRTANVPCCFEDARSVKWFYPDGLRLWARRNRDIVESLK